MSASTLAGTAPARRKRPVFCGRVRSRSSRFVIHPFRDVNTRTQFVFFNQLALHAGWLIDWTTIDPYLFGYARTVAIVSDERGIDALRYPALEPLTTFAAVTRRLRLGVDQFVTGRRSWTRQELDRALMAAVERRGTC